jgi:hypothetical protein
MTISREDERGRKRMNKIILLLSPPRLFLVGLIKN